MISFRSKESGCLNARVHTGMLIHHNNSYWIMETLLLRCLDKQASDCEKQRTVSGDKNTTQHSLHNVMQQPQQYSKIAVLLYCNTDNGVRSKRNNDKKNKHASP